MNIPKIRRSTFLMLLDCEPVVKLINGNFRVVEKTLRMSRYTLVLRVYISHPTLDYYNGNKSHSEPELVFWQGCKGLQIDMPTVVEQHAKVLKYRHQFSDYEVSRIRDRMEQSLRSFFDSMAIDY